MRMVIESGGPVGGELLFLPKIWMCPGPISDPFSYDILLIPHETKNGWMEPAPPVSFEGRQWRPAVIDEMDEINPAIAF